VAPGVVSSAYPPPPPLRREFLLKQAVALGLRSHAGDLARSRQEAVAVADSLAHKWQRQWNAAAHQPPFAGKYSFPHGNFHSVFVHNGR
jgi:hypothetical protein